MRRASIFVVFGLLLLAVTPAFAQSFVLVRPSGDRLVRDVETDLPAFIWRPVAGATGYELSLFKISTNPRTPIGTVFTVALTPVHCDASACYYAPTGPQYAMMDTGEYAWTVIANLPSGDIEASNAPFYFSVNPNPIALFDNPGFDTGTLAPWKAANLNADKLKAGSGVGGSWGFKFKGSAVENSSLIQQKNVVYYGVDGNDQLVFSADYRASKANVNLQFVVTIVYMPDTGLPKGKLKLPAVQSAAFTHISSPITPVGTVKKVKVKLAHKSPSGNTFVDNVQMTLAGQP